MWHMGSRTALLGLVLLARAAAADTVDAGMASPTGERLPAWLIEVPDTVTDILIADTSSATMHRFARAGDDIVEIDQRYMSIGQNGVGKERAWDRRTPLGVYFITERLDTTKMHEKYGVAAFPLDYPNAWDRYNERTGYGIWLHGVDRRNPDRPPLDTDGCLSLPNEELTKIADRLRPLVTPVIVTREMTWTPPSSLASLRKDFRQALDAWRQSLERGDLVAHLSLYADDFRYRDMDLGAWSSYRRNVFEARSLDTVRLGNVMLVADPEVPGLYLSRFTQVLRTANGEVTTTRRLYWRRESVGVWQIIAEDAG
jgi:hypothetical protein